MLVESNPGTTNKALSSEQWGCMLVVRVENIAGNELVGATAVIWSSLSPQTVLSWLLFLEDNTAVAIISRFALAMARPFLDTMVII
jgi:hypothetical protein